MAATKKIRYVENGIFYTHLGEKICDVATQKGGHNKWRQLMKSPRVTSFSYLDHKSGVSGTVIADDRAATGTRRAARYWYLHKTVKHKKHVLKIYIASADAIDLSALERAARKLVQEMLVDAPELTAEQRQIIRDAMKKPAARKPHLPRHDPPKPVAPPEGRQLGLFGGNG
jgi:hypothetical protein